MYQLTTWGEGLTLCGYLRSRSWKSVWNALTEDEGEQDLDDFELDRDVQELDRITLLPE